MSRIGKHPVSIPNGVTVSIEGQSVSTKGKLGSLSHTFTDDVDLSQEDNLVWVKPRTESRNARKMWGTARAVINNMVVGVSDGFSKNLGIVGVGYRAQVQGKDLVLQLGYSHEVRYPIPEGLKIECPELTRITIHGADKRQVGQVASEIRGFRPPEPYKGKGVRYEDEYILRKEGKKK